MNSPDSEHPERIGGGDLDGDDAIHRTAAARQGWTYTPLGLIYASNCAGRAA